MTKDEFLKKNEGKTVGDILIEIQMRQSLLTKGLIGLAASLIIGIIVMVVKN